jgi:hypothetical protein
LAGVPSGTSAVHHLELLGPQQVVLDELAGHVLELAGRSDHAAQHADEGLAGLAGTLGMGATPKSMPAFFALSQAQGPEIIIATWPRAKPASISA